MWRNLTKPQPTKNVPSQFTTPSPPHSPVAHTSFRIWYSDAWVSSVYFMNVDYISDYTVR